MSTIYYYLSLFVVMITGDNNKLKCNDNGSFRIVQFTDTHFGESHIGDYMTLQMMNNILDEEMPDLVVLSGDIISGYTWNGKEDWFQNLWDKLAQPMISREISWIYTLGNHDAEGQFESNRSEILKFITNEYSNLGSLTKLGHVDKDSGQNIYSVNIYDKTGNNAISKIYMIDSGQLDCNKDYDYFGCLQISQMEWYLKQDHSIPGIIYMHIPPKELMTFHNNKKYATIGQFGTETQSYLNCFDERNIKTNENDKSFIDYVLQNNDIMAMFHGHEHQFDSLILYDKDDSECVIGFGRKSGEGWMIGVDIDFRMISGARIFQFDCNNPRLWNTWIRDKHLNIIDNTSFINMKKQKENLAEINDDDDSECVIDTNKKCLTQRHWMGWKPTITQQYKNWMYRLVTDGIDVVCRLRIPRFINDYIYDLGMNDAVSAY